MPKEKLFSECDLAMLAKQSRERAGKTRAQVAREMQVSQTSIFQAEEQFEQSLVKLRIRIIEAYSDFQVQGPLFVLKKK